MTPTVPHQALYRRWRAQTFGEIVGQEAVVETLRNAVRADRVSHAVLFVGPRGTGKTSLARILAKAVNCTDLQDGDACDRCPSCVSIREGTTLDLIEIDAASNRGIDAVRDLRERLPYPPGQLRRKVYILDEAHQITRDAWNALLKSLEEPPDFVIFMFASTEPSGFPPAILSRLQRFDVRRLTVAEIEGKLTRILAADGREADPAAVHLIARLAAGGMRDAESMLDQLLSAAPDRIDEATVRDLLGLADAEVVDAFVDHLVRGDGAAGVALLDTLDERGRDIRALLDQAVEAIRAELIAGARRSGGRAPRSGGPGRRRPAAGGDRPEPRRRSAACASSSSSRCSRGRPRRRRAGRRPAPAAPAPGPAATDRGRPSTAAAIAADRHRSRRRAAADGRHADRRQPSPPPASARARRPTPTPRRPRRRARRRRRRPRHRPQPPAERAGRRPDRRARQPPPRPRPRPPPPAPRRQPAGTGRGRRPRRAARRLAGDRRAAQRPPADQAADRRAAGRSRSTARS